MGIEIAENLKKSGKNVSIIEGADQVMAPFDYDMAQLLHKEIADQGIHLYLSSMVMAIIDRYVDQGGTPGGVPGHSG